MNKVYSLIAQALTDQGVSTVFGLMGDANMLILHSLVADQQARFISAAHEGGAVSMADGWSRLSGSIGVASLTHGPGMTNAVTALTEAARAQTPMLVLTGSTSSTEPQHFQRFDLKSLCQLTGAHFRRYTRTSCPRETIGNAIADAFGNRRPVVVDFPVELLHHTVEHKHISPAATSIHSADMDPINATVDPQELDAALGMVASANRPVVVAGRGAVKANALPWLERLATRIGAPVATTLLAKGALSGSPLSLGVMGTLGHATATDVIAAADLIVAFGASLNRFTTVDGGLLDGKAVVICDDRPEDAHSRVQLDANRTSMVTADAHSAAESIVGALESEGLGADKPWYTDRISQEQAGEPTTTPTGATTSECVNLTDAALELNRILPSDRIVVSDTGRFIYPVWKYLDVSRGGDFIHTLNFASIGLGFGTGVGAAIAAGQREVVVVSGDGGGLMSIEELVTAARYTNNLIIIVCNDGAYGMEYRNLGDAGLDPELSVLPAVDFTSIAAAMGCTSICVRSMQDFSSVRDAINDHSRRPLVIEMITDPAVDPGRTE